MEFDGMRRGGGDGMGGMGWDGMEVWWGGIGWHMMGWDGIDQFGLSSVPMFFFAGGEGR